MINQLSIMAHTTEPTTIDSPSRRSRRAATHTPRARRVGRRLLHHQRERHHHDKQRRLALNGRINRQTHDEDLKRFGVKLIEIPLLEEGAQEVDRDERRRDDGALDVLASQDVNGNGGRGEQQCLQDEKALRLRKSRKNGAKRYSTNDAWSPKRFRP